MKRQKRLIGLAALVLGTVHSLPAQTFTVLGDGRPVLLGWNMSADGSVVMGFGGHLGPCYRWTAATGLQDIGGDSYHCQVSADGKVITAPVKDSQGLFSASIWQGGKSWKSIGSLSDVAVQNLRSEAYGLTADGSVIVGLSYRADKTPAGFRWDAVHGMTDVGSLQGFQTRASAISGKGNVIAGWDAFGTVGRDGEWDAGNLQGPSYRMGAVWPNGQPEGLMHPFGWIGEVMLLNDVGSIIVGRGSPLSTTHPYRYTTWDAKWEDLGTIVRWNPSRPPSDNPEDAATANAMSADGNIIVGNSGWGAPGIPLDAFIWTPANKMEKLQDYLVARGVSIPAGYLLTNATGISADGKIFCGSALNPAGLSVIFIAKLP